MASILFLVFLTGVIVSNSSVVQTRISHKVTEVVGRELGTKMYFESVDLTFINRLVFNHVLLEDQQGDTLIYSKKVQLSLLNLPKDKYLKFGKAYLDGFEMHLKQLPDGDMNIQFLADALEKKDTSSVSMLLTFNEIEMENGSFRLQIPDKSDSVSPGINFSDLYVSRIDAIVRDLKKSREGVTSMDVKKLSCKEQSGFFLDHFKSYFIIAPTKLYFLDMLLQTKETYLEAQALNFSFDDFKKWKNPSVYDEVKMDIKFSPSQVSTKDMWFFIPQLIGYNQIFEVSGDFQGTIQDMDVEDLSLRFGEHTSLLSDFSVKGLPDIQETFVFNEVKSLSTSARDLRALNLSFFSAQPIQIPDILNNMGIIRYQGSFTGFTDDFVAYGALSTAAGVINTDLSVKPDTLNHLGLQGKIATRNLHLGKIIDNELIGLMDLAITVNASFEDEGAFNSILAGDIRAIEINGYEYNNIHIDGQVSHEEFTGRLLVQDEFFDLNFKGNVDYHDKIPEFDFVADLNHANLYRMNIDKSDSTGHVSGEITAHFSSPDSGAFEGSVWLNKFLFSKDEDSLYLDDIEWQMSQNDDSASMLLNSTYLNARASASYIEQQDLIAGLKKSVDFYLPSLIVGKIGKKNKDVMLRASISVNDVRDICAYFFPDYIIEDQAQINSFYTSRNDSFSINMKSDYINMLGYDFDGIDYQLTSNNGLLKSVLRIHKIGLSKRLPLKNFKLESLIEKDSMDISLSWFDYDSVTIAGDLAASAILSRNNPDSAMQLGMHLKPSTIVYKETLWNLHPASIYLDSNHIRFKDFYVEHDNQYLSIDGKVSDNPRDVIEIGLNHFNLANINLFTPKGTLKINGNISGKAELSGIFAKPVFIADMEIDTFIINEEELGYTEIFSAWRSEKQLLDFNVNSHRGNLNTLELDGHYKPMNNVIDTDIELNKFRLDPFNQYLENIFSDIRGIASGNLNLKGTFDELVLNGDLSLNKTSFGVNYLNTRYSLSHNLKVADNNVIFDALRLYDENGNKTYLSGILSFNDFDGISLDLSFDLDDFLCLNTTPEINEQFYGTAFMAGIVSIKGAPGDLMFDISAQTVGDSKFFIPLYDQEEAGENQFVTFVQPADSVQNKAEPEKVDYETDAQGMSMDFDLEVTPDVQVQINLDSETGDVIRASGNGNLKMNINQQSNINLVGEYEITEGSYLFTLQNIINKKFNIEKGSTLLWDGEMQEAEMDILAVYRLKTSLSVLFGDTTGVYDKRIPVECLIHLNGPLTNPTQEFEIKLPTVDSETQEQVKLVLNSEEKRIRQFLSLIVLNSFYPDPELAGSGTASSGMGLGSQGVGATTSELLSNQLSNWLSQMTGEVDVGLNYRPGDEMTSDEVEVALSTQLLNDRVSIRGDLDVGGEKSEVPEQSRRASNNVVGDFYVDVKLNKSGKLRLKAFNRENDNILYENSMYTQGVGVFYREEFNSFGELMNKYWKLIRGGNSE